MQRFEEWGITSCRTARRAVGTALAALCLLTAGHATASPPRDPLPGPYFSLDRTSPSVLAGLFTAADILAVPQGPDGAVDHLPIRVIPGEAIGFGLPGDDVNASTSSNTGWDAATTFALLFSVDRSTTGVPQPDAALVSFQAAYNATDQAARNQQAADEYMAIDLFTRSGPVPPGTGSGRAPTDNNSLLRNNGDEGGTDFGAVPSGSAEADNTGGSQDNVDTMSTAPTAARGTGEPALYYCGADGSPSFDAGNLPGPPSPANVYYDPTPSALDDAAISLYVGPQELGLTPFDDIDAVVVFDDGVAGVFEPGDQVLFSLTPGSPSLTTLPVSGEAPAADIFSVTFGSQPVLFAPAVTLGLGMPNDNVDALNFFPCADGQACASAHSILRTAVPTTSEWGVVAMLLLLLIAGTAVFVRRGARA